MELQMSPMFQRHHPGAEKQQMLELNRRLEAYLSRVKLLEEENQLLTNEIQVLRRRGHGEVEHRRGLQGELQQARLEVEAAWRDSVLAQLQVEQLCEELRALELQRQEEAQAKAAAQSELQRGRKALEEERRAQVWLGEKVGQLEQQRQLLLQTHQENVVHLEATLSRSRAAGPPAPTLEAKQLDLLQISHEFSQSAARAWQEAAEAYQRQLDGLEGSLEQARGRLAQVEQEKQQSQLKLRALEKDGASARDVRLHLEKRMDQSRQDHLQQLQQLQEHLEDLEVEKAGLGQQIDRLLQENRSLVQLKMSLGLEVATYRALLDGENVAVDVASFNQQRKTSIRDATLSSRGVKTDYQMQMSRSLQTNLPSSVSGALRSIAPGAQISRKAVTLGGLPHISAQSAEKPVFKPATSDGSSSGPPPGGAAQRFGPQEVPEKVAHVQLLSAPNEQEADGIIDDDQCVGKETVSESVVSRTAEYGLRSEPAEEPGPNHSTAPSLAGWRNGKAGPLNQDSGEPAQEDFKAEAKNKDVKQEQPQTDSSKVSELNKDSDLEPEQTSDSETEAVLEPTLESRPSSPESECQLSGSDLKEGLKDENIPDSEGDEVKEFISPVVEANEREDKLYPDGEEMDTWDSVMEKKMDESTDERIQTVAEEDISAKLPEETRECFEEGDVASTVTLTQLDQEPHPGLEEEKAPPPDKEEAEDDDEDSQNVSVSWRTELESDSYAQENTLADTRPLIRYTSDETDANTQASHVDESESSDGDKRPGESGAAMWTDCRTKTFGTMEDLCEDVEEETVEEDYNLGDPQDGDDEGNEDTVRLVSETEDQVRKVTERNPTEERSDGTHDEDQFSHQQNYRETLKEEMKNVEAEKELEEVGKTKEEVVFSETRISTSHEFVLSIRTPGRGSESLFFKDPTNVMDLASTGTKEVMAHEEEEAVKNPDEHGVEDECTPTVGARNDDDAEGTDNHRDPNNPQHVTEPQDVTKSPPEEETAHRSGEHLKEDTEELHKLSEGSETTECEVQENSTLESETGNQREDALTLHKDLPEASPDSWPNGDDVYMLKEVLESSFHVSSGMKHSLWSSGAAESERQPESEPTNQNQTDKQVWGSLENPHIVNGKSKLSINPSRTIESMSVKTETCVEVKKMCSGLVLEEMVHPEDSEAEADSWSSGEEPV